MFGFENINFTDFVDHTSATTLGSENRRQESHAEREILLVLSGNVKFMLAGKCFSAVPGKAFFIDSWVPHQLGYGKLSGNITHIWVHLHAKRIFAMPYMLTADSRPQSCGMWEFSQPVLDLINSRWTKALSAPDEMKNSFYNSIVRLLTEEIAFQYSVVAEEKRREDDVISWVKNYISMNYGRNSSLAELEHLTGFNRRHLMRKFKNECSMTIGE